MAQRFSVSLNRDDYRAIVRRIQAGKFEVLCRQSLRITAYSAVLAGRPMVLIYDHKRHNLVTVLRLNEYIERRIQNEKEKEAEDA